MCKQRRDSIRHNRMTWGKVNSFLTSLGVDVNNITGAADVENIANAVDVDKITGRVDVRNIND